MQYVNLLLGEWVGFRPSLFLRVVFVGVTSYYDIGVPCQLLPFCQRYGASLILFTCSTHAKEIEAAASLFGHTAVFVCSNHENIDPNSRLQTYTKTRKLS